MKLAKEIPTEKAIPYLIESGILSEEMSEYIVNQPTRAARARTLLELLPRRGPKAFDVFYQTLMELKRDNLVSVLSHPEEEDMEICYPQYSRFNLGGGVHLEVDGGIVQLIQEPVTMNFLLGQWKVLENNV